MKYAMMLLIAATLVGCAPDIECDCKSAIQEPVVIEKEVPVFACPKTYKNIATPEETVLVTESITPADRSNYAKIARGYALDVQQLKINERTLRTKVNIIDPLCVDE